MMLDEVTTRDDLDDHLQGLHLEAMVRMDLGTTRLGKVGSATHAFDRFMKDTQLRAA